MLPTRKRQKPDRHSKKNTVSQRRAPLRQQQKLASLVSTPPSTVSSSFRSFLSFPPSLLLFNDSRRRHYPHTAYTRAGSSTDSSTELEPGPACWYPRARCCLWSCCCWTAELANMAMMMWWWWWWSCWCPPSTAPSASQCPCRGAGRGSGVCLFRCRRMHRARGLMSLWCVVCGWLWLNELVDLEVDWWLR
ncbi:hypothetical protein IWZ00DRAFT_519179 [Phyllosticta capitalensis]|uniref:Uncharacterized protein n=1 Tax=Phyllosticta capitalensis TaxID=121624 RepID=A0ABR1YDY4_9PEZI